MSREGPPAAKMVKVTDNPKESVSGDGYLISNESRSVENYRANVKVKSGKWYYEVKLNTNGEIRIGWAKDTFHPSSGAGVGEDANSWGYDGSRQYKWNGSSAWYGEYWYVGDVIGTSIDLESKKLHFYRNGRDLGLAFEADFLSSCEALNPVISLASKQKATVNFGKNAFTHPLVDKDFRALHCFLSEKELDKLTNIFNKYKNMGVSLSESGETGDLIKGQGFLEYGKAVGVVDDNDIGLLLLAWKFGAKGQWEITRDEFMSGWISAGAASLDKMKGKIDEWRKEVIKPESFRKFYFFVFDYLKETSKTVLMLEEASIIWGMVGLDSKWSLYSKWLEFLEKSKIKAITRDTWRQLFDFSEAHPKSVDNYDENGSWPVLMDSFVEFVKTGNISDF